jgi:GTP-binding protein
MKIRSVEYAGTLVKPQADFPGDLPQVAFAGRSNVGKSSLINVLLERSKKKVAHVSSTPGKTQGLNFYRGNDEFFLVDLPGFGFAQVPESVREGWKDLIEGYLSRPDGPRAVVHLVDIRRDPVQSDLKMLDFLSGIGMPTLVAFTKLDKLTRSRGLDRVAKLTEKLELDSDQVVPFSSKTGQGREALLGAVASLLVLEGP